MKTTAVILAAGQGTRMHSTLPKVLHPLLGWPMVSYSIEACRQATGRKPLVVIGHAAEQVRQALGETAEYAVQEPQLGTGHAMLQVENQLRGQTDLVLVTAADMPLLTQETFAQLIQLQQANPGPITMLTAVAEQARGFGRVLRDAEGRVQAVVEEAHASAEQLAVRELNTSIYCFAAEWLWPALQRILLSPKG